MADSSPPLSQECKDIASEQTLFSFNGNSFVFISQIVLIELVYFLFLFFGRF